MTPEQIMYFKPEDLVDRLASASNSSDRTVIFLLGSAVSLPDNEGGYGVPGVSGIIDQIRSEFEGTDASLQFDKFLNIPGTNKYQQAFHFLQGRRGQDTVNSIVRSAVCKALNPTKSKESDTSAQFSPIPIDPDIYRTLEEDPNAWILPNAVDQLGKLLVNYPDTFGQAVLTTNFDPLIEVSVLKNGGKRYRTVLHDDGNLNQTVSDGTHVVHLHGYWWGYDTLHTPQQLTQSRPRLKQSLAHVIEASILVVIGYSGWDDVVTQTLMELASDSTKNPEILWTFLETNPIMISDKYHDLLDALDGGVRRGRVSLYSGVDCRSIFSDVATRLRKHYPIPRVPVDGPYVKTEVKEVSGSGGNQRHVHIEFDVSLPQYMSSASDSPLFVNPWIGREQELRILASSNASVAFVTGLGGQGKSALAGQFLKRQALVNNGRYDFWDWRDCREESHRLNTQLLRLVERLSDGAIDASKIEVTDFEAIVANVFRLLGERRALIVFDNIDQYIDLETFGPIKGLEYLVSAAQTRSHNSLFLFTCRPDVRLDEARTTILPLAGFTKEETNELLSAHGIAIEGEDIGSRLHLATQGHPLWINLIVMQCVRERHTIDEALTVIHQGDATLPKTTRRIWNTLNKQQRDVLRTMAELDRPESESELMYLLPGINVNRINRALKTLRSFHLIEVRTRPGGEPLLGLHPLIREFVRTDFPKKDREKYVGKILDRLDYMISQFRELLSKAPSYEILEYWTRKADYQISFGHHDRATSTLEEISWSLINRGYAEEMTRLCMRLFQECDWAVACAAYKSFDFVFDRCLELMIQMDHDETDHLLHQYESAIPGKSSQFILLCNLRCYFDWYRAQFDSAIVWGEKGERLKHDSSVDTAFSCTHNLALAHRDGGEVGKAIVAFLGGETLESVIDPNENIDGKSGHYYGNIGRCLHKQNRLEDTMICYIKSARLLQGGRDYMDFLNRGYVRLWIGELLVDEGQTKLGGMFLRSAMCVWEEYSPPRAAQVRQQLVALGKEDSRLEGLVDVVEWKAEGAFLRWLDEQ